MAEQWEEGPVLLRRNYACLALFLLSCVCFAASISLVAGGRFVVLGIVLAPFAFVEAAQYGLAIFERPTLDRVQTLRLLDAMNEVSLAAGFGEPYGYVYVQTLVHEPIRFWTKRPIIKADLMFVKGLNNSQLRAVSGYGVAQYLFPPATSVVSIYVGICAVLGVGIGIAAASARSLVLGAALIPFAVWVATVGLGVIASTYAVRSYQRTDAQAAAILGNPSEVAMALALIRDARTTLRAAETPVHRLLVRCIQPITPSWHEDERSKLVCSQPVAALATPKVYQPKTREPQYEP